MALGISSCSISTPFSAPQSWEGARSADNDREVVLSVTHITLKRDSRSKTKFWRSVRLIDEAIANNSGFIGYAKRREVFGENAWTVSAWQDASSLRAFIQSDAHRHAMEQAADTFADARFARVTVPMRRIPLSWEETLSILERNARHYYE